jgi:hypothetical protein
VTQNPTQTTTNGNKKISIYVTLIVLIVLALSIVSLILAVSTYPSNSYAAGFFALIGLVALTMSLFTLYQSRRQTAQMKIEIPKVMTTIECKKCNSKTQREFQRGDYVYKELDACQKCPDQKQIITAIYKEVKEKEKTFNV